MPKLSAAVLELIMDENLPQNSVKKDLIKRKIRKLSRHGKLDTCVLDKPGRQQIDWAFRIFAASVMLGDYSWWGWECRSDWAWELANKKWYYPKWNGKPCKLLVLAEQGIGDEIMFSSCFGDLHRDNPDLTIEADPRLIPIMERSYPGIRFVTRHKNKPDENGRLALQLSDYRGDFDAFIPAGSVASLYRKGIKDFPRKPFLKPLDGDPIDKIGYVNVAGANEEKRINEPLGDINLHHVHGDVTFDDFDEYVTYIASLKQVNTVPAAVAHICGAIGQKCNVIKPPLSQGTALKWYYPNDRDMDWYDVKIYQKLKDFRK